jgi:hypothetical protein
MRIVWRLVARQIAEGAYNKCRAAMALKQFNVQLFLDGFSSYI